MGETLEGRAAEIAEDWLAPLRAIADPGALPPAERIVPRNAGSLLVIELARLSERVEALEDAVSQGCPPDSFPPKPLGPPNVKIDDGGKVTR